MFGLFQRKGADFHDQFLAILQKVCNDSGNLKTPVWKDQFFIGCPNIQSQSPEGFIFLAEARIDNREELARDLGIPPHEASLLTDEKLLRRAYDHWREDCPKRIYGDWTFAAWHPRKRRLFLARDHFGNSSLYYHIDDQILAFSSMLAPLLAMNLTPVKLDELYLAQVLTSWPANHGERTIYHPIKRLPPAHSLEVTAQQTRLTCYWRMEDVKPLILPRREDYLEPFLAVFDEAVRTRLRPPPGANEPHLASMLSGGLDSGAVAATAAMFLRKEGKRLPVYTSVPVADTNAFVGKRFGDETAFASATARYAGNIDHHLVNASELTPIQAIRRMLGVTLHPEHAAGNFFWMQSIDKQARKDGARVLLNGQLGNAGISWTGSIFSQPLITQLSSLGLKGWLKERTKRALPPSYWSRRYQHHWRSDSGFYNTAIHPEFARRLNLAERRAQDPSELFTPSPYEMRLRIIKPGQSFIGALYAAKKAASGLEYRDPTGDPRVLSFCLSVPDWVFIDPETGLDRWLIRAAMKGRLPDVVRLNRRRGRQSGDLVHRLRSCAGEVDGALSEIASGPAIEYLDMNRIKDVWSLIQTKNSPQAFHLAMTVLTRGIMAGLFINQFFCNTPPRSILLTHD